MNSGKALSVVARYMQTGHVQTASNATARASVLCTPVPYALASRVRSTTAYYAIFFAGGMPALVYQVVWQRVLKLYVGVDIYAAGIIVASFMLGLGLGSLLGGLIADRIRRPAAGYAVCELLLGAFGVLSIPLFSFVGTWLAHASPGMIMLITFALLLIPTVLMGATLPLMCSALTAHDAHIGGHLSRLYAWNTLGAALGALLTTYLVIGLLGLTGATLIAGAFNVALALLVFGLCRLDAPSRTAAEAPAAAMVQASSSMSVLGYRDVLIVAFLSGFTALAYELIWYRILGNLLHSTVYVFGTLLFFFLLGIGTGSLLARRTIDLPGAATRFALCQLGIGGWVLLTAAFLSNGSQLPGIRHLLAAATFTSFHPAPSLIAGHIDTYSVYSLLGLIFWMAVILLPPTILMGYGFPNLLREGATSVRKLGKDLSGVLFLNIVGATTGSLAVSLVGLRYFGTERTLTVLLLIGCAAPAIVFWRKWRKACPIVGGPAAHARRLTLTASLAVLILFAAPGPQALLRAIHYADQPGVEAIIREDHTGTVVLRRQSEVITFELERRILDKWRLHIDGSVHGELRGDGSAIVPEAELQCALGVVREPRRVLSIGLGDGVMCATAAACPQVRELLVVELNGALHDVLTLTAYGKAIDESGKLRFVRDDGRRWLIANPTEKFDVIMMWPLHAAHAYSGAIYSHEFLALIRSRLNPGGLLYTKTTDAYSTARTIADVFPHVVRLDEGVYLCSDQALNLESAREPQSPEWLAENVQANRDLILEYTAGSAINRDFFPISEFYVTYSHVEQLITRTDRYPVTRYRMPTWRSLK